MYKISRHTKAGFNLIELIVVIAIMGILSSIIYGSFAGARAAARDDARKTDLKNLQLAIEFYKAQNGVYPAGGCGMHANDRAWASPGLISTGVSYGDNPLTSLTQENCPEYIVGLVPDYISQLPVERNFFSINNHNYRYAVNRDRTNYKLIAHYTVESADVSPNSEFYRCPTSNCPSSTYCRPELDKSSDAGLIRTFAVYSDGAACW